MFGKSESAGRWPPLGPITWWPPEPLNVTADVKIVIFDPPSKPIDTVGEGSYQGTLERVAGGRSVDGGRLRDHVAILLPEPTNVYDPNAVRVVLLPAGGTVGYLSRENAVAYRGLIERVAKSGKLVACRASIRGGWDRGADDRGHFGVRLYLNTPASADRELESTPEVLQPTWEE